MFHHQSDSRAVRARDLLMLHHVLDPESWLTPLAASFRCGISIAVRDPGQLAIGNAAGIK
jgi:hypothetical protein